MPEGLIGLPTLSEGSRVAVQLDNLTEGDITLNPEWEVGAISSVHLTQSPTGDQMPQIPDSLSFEQQRDLRRLLDEYKDVFSKEGQPISSTSLVEHEIHTTGPAVRLPFQRQNPVIRDIEQQQVKVMLQGYKTFHQSLGFSSCHGEKERWDHEILHGFLQNE